jgi:hypothetical protein
MRKKLLIFILALGLFPATAMSEIAEIAPQPCDPGFYKQMTARAWLESEREIMQNQNLIFKADSVLEYTCFDQYANITAWAGGDIFTHSPYFGDPLINRGEPYGLEVALNNIIIASYEDYQTDNFEHSLLGGRGHHVGIDMFNLPVKAANGQNIFTSVQATNVSAAQENGGVNIFPTLEKLDFSVCPVMSEVWAKAKCLNFVHNAKFSETDSFYPFKPILCADGAENCTPIEHSYLDLPGDPETDARVYPDALKCESESGIYTWDGASTEAANLGEPHYLFQTPLGEIFDNVLKRTAPGACTDAIGTGVTVILADVLAHQDGVCSNPGCTYTAPGGEGLGTCE